MSSQENPGASSSRGTAIPQQKATNGSGNLGNRIVDVDNALGQPITGDFKLKILQELDDPEGDYNVQVSGCAAPQHDLPKASVPDLVSELYKEIMGEIVDQFYGARFQQLEIVQAHACEYDLEGYYTCDDDDYLEVC